MIEEKVIEKVQEWSELPLCLTETSQMPDFMLVNAQKAIHAGLTFRPLTETIFATFEWNASRKPTALKVGLERTKESKLLADWETHRQ